MPFDIVHLRFYSEYQWLIDFSVYAIVIYSITETYQVVFKAKDEINLSILWCFLVVGFAMYPFLICILTFFIMFWEHKFLIIFPINLHRKVLLSLTRQYFQSESSGERSTVIVTGFVYFLLAMVILIIDEHSLELGLETAYKVFNRNAVTFLEKQGINSS